MKLTIHRGTNQIGGCVTEIESGGYRVFIDFGEQLPGTEKALLQPIDGLTCGDVTKSVLFISHYHGDHIGMVGETVADLPVYVGETALDIYNCLESHLSHIPDPGESDKHKRIVERIKSFKTFRPLQKIAIGGIVISPLMIDHSAFDAYMFVIEADNRRILHTGDFRGHGLRSKALFKMLEVYALDIDYIISEGSNISRSDASVMTERELQTNFEKQFRKYKYNFVIISSTNIDRLFAMYHASKYANRCFVCDNYQSDILKLVSERHMGKSSFYDIEYSQTKKPSGRFFILERRGRMTFSFDGKLKPYLDRHGFCMIIRSTEAFELLLAEYATSNEFKLYYSMWEGYLDRGKAAFNKSLSDFLKPYNPEHMHTSGHADIKTLKMVFETVKPRCGIIPIHTDNPTKFQELFDGLAAIILLKDGEVFDCVGEKAFL